jgi:hypothetical protein
MPIISIGVLAFFIAIATGVLAKPYSSVERAPAGVSPHCSTTLSAVSIFGFHRNPSLGCGSICDWIDLISGAKAASSGSGSHTHQPKGRFMDKILFSPVERGYRSQERETIACTISRNKRNTDRFEKSLITVFSPKIACK